MMDDANYYPVFLNLHGKKCIVVGGGTVAERKVRPLYNAGAKIILISPDITAGLRKLVSDCSICHKPRRYRRGDARGAFLVIAATSDESVNAKVYEDTDGLINAVDMPSLCNFIVPSVVSKDPLRIAISSSGLSPALSRTIRKDLENYIPDALSEYLSYLDDVRLEVRKHIPGSSRRAVQKRTRLLRKLGSKEVYNVLKSKGFRGAKQYADTLLKKELK